MTWNQLSTGRAGHRLDRRIALGLIVGYPLLYLLGYLSKSVAGSAAIWPAHAIAFAAFMLLPLRAWPLVALGIVSWEVFARPVLYWITIQSPAPLPMSLSFALANILTTMGPAGLARMMRLFRRQERFALVISPLWIVALIAGALPGALIGSATGAQAANSVLAPADVGLWILASVLTIVTFGPMVFGLLLGFSEPTATPVRQWEGWAVSLLVLALFVFFAVVPWRAVEIGRAHV